MARTHSSYTASPTRAYSPRRSPARRPSKEDGSEYEMDLDALGLNSTFESTELQASYEPPVDHVDTSEIEGPDDFTMNMTYWMTADLPLAQIKSRKEAKGRVEETRMDALQAQGAQVSTEEGGEVILDDTKEHIIAQSTSASPTRRANGTTDDRNYSTPASERSMENDEKVRSFLSALPDTDMEGAIAGTPLHVPKQSFLQVPRSSPPKARSLQPTVEDYDTPRKPTQETVIHHTSAAIEAREHDALREQIADLQARLEQQEMSSKTRITELETILSYTRTELDEARTNNYKQKEKSAALEHLVERQKAEIHAAQFSADTQLATKEKAFEMRMQDFGEEMRLQNLAKLHNQQEESEKRVRELEKSKRLVDEQIEARGQDLEQVKAQLAELRQTNEQALRDMQKPDREAQDVSKTAHMSDISSLMAQLSSVQARANALQAALETATTDAKISREEAERAQTMRTQMESHQRADKSRLAALETNLRDAKFELECAQADIAAKQQLFQTNLDLNAQLRKLRSDLETAHTSSNLANQHHSQTIELESRIKMLQNQLQSSHADQSTKDQQILDYIEAQEQSEKRLNMAQGRMEGLDSTITTLRQQLAEAHRDSAKARTDVERLERDAEDANDRLHDARAEADRRIADFERKLSAVKESKVEAERKFKELQSQRDDLVEGHEAMMEDVRDKAEDAVRKAGTLLEQERTEKRRTIKELKRVKDELSRFQSDAAQRLAQEDSSSDDDDDSTSLASVMAKKEKEIAELREIIRKQVVEVKTLKSETTALKKENKDLKVSSESHSDLKATISSLESHNTALQGSLEDQEVINAAMDEKLASMLSKLMKERARSVIGKRDGQWAESVGKVQDEREMLGKVLLRQWGREEVGVADEKNGEPQMYKYKYVKR